MTVPYDTALWKILRKQVTDRANKIDVWFRSPARHLIQNSRTKTISGVQIERENVLRNIRAKNGAMVGTNADFSYNLILLQYIKKHFAGDADIDVCEIKDIPAFNEDLSVIDQDRVQELAHKIEASDGVIIGCPECDHSIPAVLKSTIEWLS